jgi:hypothetical protein
MVALGPLRFVALFTSEYSDEPCVRTATNILGVLLIVSAVLV